LPNFRNIERTRPIPPANIDLDSIAIVDDNIRSIVGIRVAIDRLFVGEGGFDLDFENYSESIP
jgi:hypothetical protein